MLTAKADVESKLDNLEVGADDYLTKPFNVKELKLKIKNILLQRNRLREHLKNRFLFTADKLTADDKFLQKASEIIQANLSNSEFSVEEFQQEMGYSKTQLYRKIKAITGQSASEFIRLIRLKKAALMLESDDAQIAQIAYETGFNSPAYFTKCFRETFGKTPSEYVQKKIETICSAVDATPLERPPVEAIKNRS
jgi:AraC-like DNA-binding protein